MAFVRSRARILEISTTSGSGPLALAGAADNSYNRFSSFMSVGDQTFVTVVEPGVAFWSGIATYSAANQITLTTVEETKGTFGSGTKEVMASPLASISMLREDISGAIVTGGTSTAYTAASFRKYETLAQLDGNIIAFTPHVTNVAGSPNVTLNVDGLGAKTIQSKPGVDIPAGVLIAGTPYVVLYNHASGIFYVQNSFYGNPYNIPIGGCIDFFGSTAPNSSLVMPYGQAISRTVYASCFAVLGTTYGVGDGSTTFNVPNLRGRVVAGKDDMGGSALGLIGSVVTDDGTIVGTTLGSKGGTATHVLTTTEMPTHNHGVTDPGHSHNYFVANGTEQKPQSGGVPAYVNTTLATTTTNTTGITIQNAGNGAAHALLQPTIIANKLIRII